MTLVCGGLDNDGNAFLGGDRGVTWISRGADGAESIRAVTSGGRKIVQLTPRCGVAIMGRLSIGRVAVRAHLAALARRLTGQETPERVADMLAAHLSRARLQGRESIATPVSGGSTTKVEVLVAACGPAAGDTPELLHVIIAADGAATVRRLEGEGLLLLGCGGEAAGRFARDANLQVEGLTLAAGIALVRTLGEKAVELAAADPIPRVLPPIDIATITAADGFRWATQHAETVAAEVPGRSAVAWGGDGVTPGTLGKLCFQVRSGNNNATAPDEPSTGAPPPCGEPVDGLLDTYTSTTDLFTEWTETDLASIGTWTLETPPNPTHGSPLPRVLVEGSVTLGDVSKITRPFGSYAPGTQVEASWHQLENLDSAHGPADQWNAIHTAQLLTADTNGEVTVTLSWRAFSTTTISNSTIYFGGLTLTSVCDTGESGDGGGDPTDPGGDPGPGPDPGTIPTPVGEVFFGVFLTHGQGISAIGGLAPYNCTVPVVSPSSIANFINAAEADGWRLLPNISDSRNHWTNSNGTFNFELWKTWTARYRGSLWTTVMKPAQDRGTVPFWYMIDEPYCIPCFGGQRIPHNVVDEMARLFKSWYPGARVVVRMNPSRMLGFAWRYVDCAWAQYEGPLHDTAKTAQAYISREIAAAQSLGLRVIWGLNLLNAGDGSSGVRGSVFHESGALNSWETTATEVRTYGLPLAVAARTRGEGLMFWKYSATHYARSGMAAALLAVAEEVAG